MKSITGRYWTRSIPFTPAELDRKTANDLHVYPELIALLSRRGINEPQEIERFLYPTLQDIEDPFSMKGMKTACKILHQAVIDNEEIIIWGDYDVDGTTATSLLIRFFAQLNIKVNWFIPNRFSQGYGLDIGILDTLSTQLKKPVLITVDCGIANYAEVKFAKNLGFKVIVTDHHEPGDKDIEADAVLNARQRGCSFKDKNLAGVGTAFYLALGLRSYLIEKSYFDSQESIPNMKKLLDLVAIGTIADMVALKDCNRILVKAGFEVIDTSPSTGIAALLTECDIYSKITSEDIAFQIAPKINAAGRIKEASLAVELLIEEDPGKAKKIAQKLTLLNNKRKKLCVECLEYTLGI